MPGAFGGETRYPIWDGGFAFWRMASERKILSTEVSKVWPCAIAYFSKTEYHNN